MEPLIFRLVSQAISRVATMPVETVLGIVEQDLRAAWPGNHVVAKFQARFAESPLSGVRDQRLGIRGMRNSERGIVPSSFGETRPRATLGPISEDEYSETACCCLAIFATFAPSW
jgi:hypothetical protein